MAFKRSSVRSRSAPPVNIIKRKLRMPYFVYILKSESSGASYAGHTADLEKRIMEHNNGKNLSTRKKGPWKIVHSEQFETRWAAAGREQYFKSIAGRLELKAKGIL